MSGNDIQLPDHSFEEMFTFAGLSKEDTFYHLGCGDGSGLKIALEKFNVKRVIGVDSDQNKIKQAQEKLQKVSLADVTLECNDIRTVDIIQGAVILFWFTDDKIITDMMQKFEKLDNCRIITIWGPLPNCLPDMVKFPYIICKTPFKKMADIKDQVKAIFGVDCIDFVTAWENAELYTHAIEPTNSENDRFLTILQTINIWINARNMGVACGKEIPLPIKTYMRILEENFGIEVEHLLNDIDTS